MSTTETKKDPVAEAAFLRRVRAIEERLAAVSPRPWRVTYEGTCVQASNGRLLFDGSCELASAVAPEVVFFTNVCEDVRYLLDAVKLLGDVGRLEEIGLATLAATREHLLQGSTGGGDAAWVEAMRLRESLAQKYISEFAVETERVRG